MNDRKPHIAKRQLPNECLSDLTLDRLRLEELDPKTAAQAEQHIESCLRCRARHRTLFQETQALTADLPNIDTLLGAPRTSGATAASTNVVTLNASRTHARLWGPVVALVSAAAAILVLLGRPDEKTGGIRLKGNGAVMDLYVRRGEEVFRWQAQPLKPGDQLRYSFHTTEPLHVAVLSKDGANGVSQYFPTEPESWSLTPGEALSPTATQLDATLGTETLWVVYCHAPFTTYTLTNQLRQGDAVEPADGCSTQRIAFTKVAP